MESVKIRNIKRQFFSIIRPQFSIGVIDHMIKTKNLFLLSFLLIFSCGREAKKTNGLIPNAVEVESAKMEENALSQSMPTLMVFPSDAMLYRLGYLKQINNQGTVSYQRDYQEVFIKNPDMKFAIAAVQEEFAKIGFPIEDMEQQLKQIANNTAMDEATDVARDSRAELLNTVLPDYIIELDYNFTTDSKSRNLNKKLTYAVKVLDVYTNKAVASISKANVVSETHENNLAATIKEDFPSSLDELKNQVTGHYANLLANGVEITLRVAASKNSSIKIDDDCGDQELNERINNWLKDNTMKQAFKMSKNTSTEMYFTNVRIAARTADGKKYTAYDFAGELNKSLKKWCGLKSKNKTQSIGNANIIIEGVK